LFLSKCCEFPLIVAIPAMYHSSAHQSRKPSDV
jgi:hypothetical protein